jgi:hypothetical protein
MKRYKFAAGLTARQKAHALVVAVPLTLSLCACGGDDRSGLPPSSALPPASNPTPVPTPTPPPTPTPTAFTNWESVPTSGVVSFTGATVEARYSNPVGSSIFGTIGDIAAGNLTANFTYSSGAQTGISVRGALSSIAFTSSDGSTSVRLAANPSIVKFTSPNGNATLLVTDPSAAGYSFMAHGAWRGTTASGGLLNGFAGGSATSPASLPASGSATYAGTAVGYNATDGGVRIGDSLGNVSLVADFAAKSLQLSSGAGSSPMFGRLTDNANSGIFTGSVGARSPDNNSGLFGWSGTISGRFYGPNAEEFAGTFFMTSSFGGCGPGCLYIGAIGGKRQ